MLCAKYGIGPSKDFCCALYSVRRTRGAPPPPFLRHSSSKNGGQKKDLSFVCYCGNSSEEKAGAEEKTVKEGFSEGVVEKLRANWCIPSTYEGVEPQRAIKMSVFSAVHENAAILVLTFANPTRTPYIISVFRYTCANHHAYLNALWRHFQ